MNNYFNSTKKRLFDIFLSIILLVLIFPLVIVLLPFLYLKIGYPIIFKQERFGKNKKIFTIYKIRTMKIGSEAKQKSLSKANIAPIPMFKVEDDPRFISLGKIISKLGIDELPQLLNILKGEMSFVGPRPLPVYEAVKLSSSWNFRYEARPGLISFWALSPKRYESLSKWKELEKNTLRINSVKEEVALVFKAIDQIIIKRIHL
ncbi:MAG: sugar transferase [Pseudomonadales bacterium]|nr:sugar transferase [Pseudomonadales bacterium]